MPDNTSQDCALLRSLVAELVMYLDAPEPPIDIRFASIRWEIIRRMSLMLSQPSRVPCEPSRRTGEQQVTFDVDWRAFVASWSGVWIFKDWNAARTATRLMLTRLNAHLDELATGRYSMR